ncbi:MAG: zinc/manganese transport system substrate-binding protein [Glaciecola sp.]|jgi:zinc/manganese transport system substrate-binding protein
MLSLPQSSLFALAAALALTGCAAGESPPVETNDARITIVASTSVYGDIAATVGGDRVTVTSIIDSPTSHPGEYEPTPSDAAAVAAAQLVLVNGGGYDPFLPPLVDAAGGDRAVLVVTEISGLQPAEPADAEFNEHVWFSLNSMQRLATSLADTLGTISPDGAAAFTANAEALNGELDGLLAELETIRAQHAGTRVAATEPLPLYLLEDAGLVNATPDEFMEASEEGTDAPAAIVQQTLELMSGDQPVRVLLLNTQTQTPATDLLQQAALEADVPVVEVNETLPEGSDGFVAWMRDQIAALAAALDQSR